MTAPVAVKVGGVLQLIKVGKALRESSKLVGIALKRELEAQADFLLERIKQVSPISDRWHAGRYKGSWEINRTYTSKKTNTITSVSLINAQEYAIPLEEGSTPGNKPWPTARERTVVSNGKIWSTQAIGGVSSHITIADKERMQNALGRSGYESLSGVLDGVT